MLITDAEIKADLASKKLLIENFSEESLQAASYDMRIGARLLMSSDDIEIDLAARKSAVLQPGVFALVTTHENVTLPSDMAGHIGVRSYYTRKGLVVLTGLQIDPGFSGVLVIGLYNAAPRGLTLEYLAPFCTVEFHQLSRAAENPFIPGAEQRLGQIPRADKDYLRTLETQSLSEVSQNIRTLTADVSALTGSMNTMKDSMKGMQSSFNLGLTIIGVLIAGVGLVLGLLGWMKGS